MGGVFGFVSIALGAFVEHGLKSRISVEQYHSLSTALRYQQTHALIIVVIGFILVSQNAIKPVASFKIWWLGIYLGDSFI